MKYEKAHDVYIFILRVCKLSRKTIYDSDNDNDCCNNSINGKTLFSSRWAFCFNSLTRECAKKVIRIRRFSTHFSLVYTINCKYKCEVRWMNTQVESDHLHGSDPLDRLRWKTSWLSSSSSSCSPQTGYTRDISTSQLYGTNENISQFSSCEVCMHSPLYVFMYIHLRIYTVEINGIYETHKKCNAMQCICKRYAKN